MLGTSTHDTKRGEDTRARLAVLSELPEEWERQVQAWSRIMRARRGDIESTAPPDRNDEYLLYQLLVGAWPVELIEVGALDAEALGAFAHACGRGVDQVRARGEAPFHLGGAERRLRGAAQSFLRDCLDASRSNPFLDSFLAFAARIARLGVLNSLVQTVIKLTVPGVPDLYQGAELWDLSLVDPDNRRPIDYGERWQLMAKLEHDACRLCRVARPVEGRGGEARADFADPRAAPNPFRSLRQAPTRRWRSSARAKIISAPSCAAAAASVVVAVPRLFAALDPEPGWATTIVRLPPASAQRWRNVLTDAWW